MSMRSKVSLDGLLLSIADISYRMRKRRLNAQQQQPHESEMSNTFLETHLKD